MAASASYDLWMQSGRLAPYVAERKSAGAGITMFECAQPPGDMSDPATSSLVLVHILSDGVKQRSDLGGGRRDSIARAGAIALCPPYFASDIHVFVPHRIRVLAFEAEHFRDVLEEARPGREPFNFGRLHDRPFAVQHLGPLLHRMWGEAADHGAGRLFAEGAALQVLAMLGERADGAEVPVKGGLAPWAEKRVREYLDAFHASNISLDELAALVGLSKFHFTRMFKQSTGTPPYVYLRRIRVERAQRLLIGTDLPVTEIGAGVGYDTPQAFARMFRAETGLSPTQWRRAYRNG
jgi:AraC family transcriptional regulator